MNPNFRGLHVLADDDARWKCDPVAQAEAACRGGAQVIQLRAKSTPDTRVLEWARKIRSLTRGCGALFVVNDRFDLALAAEADGVHLGQEDLSPLAIPREARGRLAIGRSTHTMEQIASARSEPVDYLAFGPVFRTESKMSRYEPKGLRSTSPGCAHGGTATPGRHWWNRCNEPSRRHRERSPGSRGHLGGRGNPRSASHHTPVRFPPCPDPGESSP